MEYVGVVRNKGEADRLSYVMTVADVDILSRFFIVGLQHTSQVQEGDKRRIYHMAYELMKADYENRYPRAWEAFRQEVEREISRIEEIKLD